MSSSSSRRRRLPRLDAEISLPVDLALGWVCTNAAFSLFPPGHPSPIGGFLFVVGLSFLGHFFARAGRGRR